jgi:hypothetical protein
MGLAKKGGTEVENVLHGVLIFFTFIGIVFGRKKRASHANPVIQPIAEARGIYCYVPQVDAQRAVHNKIVTERPTEPPKHMSVRSDGRARAGFENLSTREKFLIWKENVDQISEMHRKDWERRRIARSQESYQAG